MLVISVIAGIAEHFVDFSPLQGEEVFNSLGSTILDFRKLLPKSAELQSFHSKIKAKQCNYTLHS